MIAKALENWEDTLRLIPGYDPFIDAGDCEFDAEAAQLAIDFFPECLTHVKGEWAGSPILLEPWEKSVIGNMFGWKRPDGTRRYRTAFLYVPRKNAKTTIAAGLVVYVMFCDNEPGAEIYSVAADRDQAKLVFVATKAMIQADPILSEQCTVYQHSIVAKDGITSYKPISAEAGTKHGFNTHLAVVDELHTQPNSDLVEVLETSMGSRRQPLMVYLTTADYKRDSICNTTYDYACRVRDGIIEDSAFLPIIYEADIKDDWKAESTWKKANPNYDVSVKSEYIKAACQKAEDSPQFENTFKRLHLNIQTETDVRFLSMEKWDLCDEAVSESELIGKECFTGIDLASNTDIAGIGHVFPWDDGKFVFLPRYFIPKYNAYSREKRDKVPYTQWARDKYLTMTPGNVIDYGYIKKVLEEDYTKFNIREIAFDRWGFEAFRQQVISEGVDESKLIAFGQGFASMSAPTKELEKLVLAEKMIHSNHPVTRWMASNVVVEQDAAGNLKPNKKKSTEKIDGIVMLIMGLGRAITQPPETVSVYESRGLIGV